MNVSKVWIDIDGDVVWNDPNAGYNIDVWTHWLIDGLRRLQPERRYSGKWMILK